MKNKLTDLNDYLFEAIEKIQTAESDEERKDAIEEGRAVAVIGKVIIKNANVQLSAFKYVTDEGLTIQHDRIPDILITEANAVPRQHEN